MNNKIKSNIEFLKEQLADVAVPEFTDFDYLRWLQGHDYKLDIVLPKLRHHFSFLRSYDFVNHSEHTVLKKYWPAGLLGNSGKDDNMVFIQAHGKTDAEGIMKSASSTTIMKFLVHNMETLLNVLRDHEQKTGRQSGVLLILDFDGLVLNETLIKVVKGPLRVLLTSYTQHYAEFMQKTICINLPSFVYYLYQLVKPVLQEKTRRKIIFMGSNWREEILEHIDSGVLPVHWGGTMTEDAGHDLMCKSKITVGSTVDPCFYWTPNENDPAKNDLKVFIVQAWKYDYLTFYVENSGSILEWYFFANKDFGFGVFFTNNENEIEMDEMEMVYPQNDRMAGPSLVPEKDHIICSKKGFYKLRFNNDFSWMNRLKIRYQIELKSHE